jgi:hypothetical protein
VPGPGVVAGAFTDPDPRAVADAIWAAAATPVDTIRAAETLIGLTAAAARLTAAVVLTTSPEVDALVAVLPRMVRSLTVATNARTDRYFGEIRGPIVWNETLAARAATASDPAIFVCSSLQRAYDTPENRVLVSALRSVVDAGILVERQGLRTRNSDLARHVRHNAGLANRYLDHRALSGVTSSPDRRDVMRARSGKHRGTYLPALAVLRRAAGPIGPDHVAALSSPRTRAQHAAFVAVLDALARRGRPVPPLRSVGTTFAGGPVAFVHDDHAARHGRAPGVWVGDDLLLDVAVDSGGRVLDGDTALAALSGRAGAGVSVAVVRDVGDVDWALDRAEGKAG